MSLRSEPRGAEVTPQNRHERSAPDPRAARPYRVLRAPLLSALGGAAAGAEVPRGCLAGRGRPEHRGSGAVGSGAAASRSAPHLRRAGATRPVQQRLRAPPCQRRAPACRRRPAAAPPRSTPRGATAPPANGRRRGTAGRGETANRMAGGAGAGPAAAGPAGKCSAGRARPARGGARCRRLIPAAGVRSPNPARAPPGKALPFDCGEVAGAPGSAHPCQTLSRAGSGARGARDEHRSNEFPPAGGRESNQRGNLSCSRWETDADDWRRSQPPIGGQSALSVRPDPPRFPRFPRAARVRPPLLRPATARPGGSRRRGSSV